MTRNAYRALVSCLAPLCVTAVALAQGTQGPRTPKLDTVASPVVGYALMVILSGIVLAISLYPSKRAHTDL
ncbi:MAG: hypothetical protein U0572_06350 [Phycisphaerales bacterium]